jgi:adhesin transport system membrane fusion protein
VNKYLEMISDWDANRKLIAACALTLFLILGWASVAQTEEVTRGMGKVIPSSKAQLVQPAEPAVVEEILVRAGQSVKQGQLLVRLDDDIADSELSRLQTENERLTARAARLEGEASGTGANCVQGEDCGGDGPEPGVRHAHDGTSPRDAGRPHDGRAEHARISVAGYAH